MGDRFMGVVLSRPLLVIQVTNPPIDPLREGLVMSLTMRLGKRGNLLQPGPDAYSQVCPPATLWIPHLYVTTLSMHVPVFSVHCAYKSLAVGEYVQHPVCCITSCNTLRLQLLTGNMLLINKGKHQVTNVAGLCC